MTDIETDAATGKASFQLKGFEPQWGYSQAVRHGSSLYVSGTVSIDADGEPRAVGDMAGQVRNVYADLAQCLAAFGATMGHVLRDALVTTDLDRFRAEGMEERARAYAGHALPASASWIEVPKLANPAFLFEVDVIAHVPTG